MDSCPSFLLGGDYNIDFLSNSPNKTFFSDLLQTLNIKQLITEPTRITTKSKTLLDLMITNSKTFISQSGVLQHPPIADHFTTYAICKLSKTKTTPITKMVRNVKHFIATDYIRDFLQLDFNKIYLNCPPEQMLFAFNELLRDVIDKHAPLKLIKVTRPPTP